MAFSRRAMTFADRPDVIAGPARNVCMRVAGKRNGKLINDTSGGQLDVDPNETKLSMRSKAPSLSGW